MVLRYMDNHRRVLVSGNISLKVLVLNCSISSGSSTTNYGVTESSGTPKLAMVIDNDADKGKPLVSDEWLYIFDKIGREFIGSIEVVRVSVAKYKLATCYKIRILKNGTTHYTAKFKENGCSWRIHFVLVNEGLSRFVLKDANMLHRLKSPSVTTKIVKYLISEHINGDPSLKPNQTILLFKRTFGSNVEYHYARTGKEASYKYLRPMIYLDVTFITGRFKGGLLATTCVNGNNGFYPYDFSLIHVEDKANWEWFLNNPKEVVDARPIVTRISRLLATYSYTYANYEVGLRGMHVLGCGYVFNYIRTIPMENWAFAFFLVRGCGAHSSSVAESFNNWISDDKKFSTYALLDEI
ncbi:uncharacterized protein LOC113272603 [Papaver somniferum]|uniref:uncharacterized protein LOC113272603 n=1 Tax=Papaver somniferum TaxID=3469 RepID=UPI000E6F6E5F|nr:uncharacterized protein LOC113272603 [Papaver somniferum]